ncbi:MAG: hypothetical protein JWP12_1089 [Bacteroidetes bacterium]|nr:hypothetical protein [Bacteroidota bacterium]
MDHSFNRRNISPICNRWLLFILLISFSAALAQDAPKFSIKLKFSIDHGGLENSLITITRDGKPYRVIDPNKGKYNIDLELGSEFSFTFTKPGYITKVVIVDTHVPNGREKEEFAKMVSEVSLQPQPEDQIVTYSQPVGKIKYTMARGDFDFDNDYTKTAQEMEKKAEANPTPKPKPPTPNPRAETTPPPTQTIAPSNPIPVAVKQPEYKPEPPKPKPVEVIPDPPAKPIVKNKVENVVQEDRRKITNITVTIDGVDYVYKKEEYNWGGVYFYKNGKNITESTYNKETE